MSGDITTGPHGPNSFLGRFTSFATTVENYRDLIDACGSLHRLWYVGIAADSCNRTYCTTDSNIILLISTLLISCHIAMHWPQDPEKNEWHRCTNGLINIIVHTIKCFIYAIVFGTDRKSEDTGQATTIIAKDKIWVSSKRWNTIHIAKTEQ